jgi:hypothetical protein
MMGPVACPITLCLAILLVQCLKSWVVIYCCGAFSSA